MKETKVILHGLGQTPASWEQIHAFLPVPWVYPSLPGLCPKGQADYPALSQGFARFCQGIPGPLELCGLSLGAVLALDFALSHPERVRSLVLIGAQVKMPAGLLRLQNGLFRLMPSSAFGETGFGKKDFLRLCRSMVRLDFSQKLPALHCPVLVLCGERDRANKNAAKALACALPNGQLKTIAGAGHEANRDAPEALARLLGDFWGYRRDGK